MLAPHILNALLGTKIKVIAGYEPGQGDATVMENGEAPDGLADAQQMQSDIDPQKREQIDQLLATACVALRTIVDKAGTLFDPTADER